MLSRDGKHRRLPRPRALRRFSPEVRAQAVVHACSLPQEEGVPLARWSYAEITRRLVMLGLVARGPYRRQPRSGVG